MKIKLHKPKQAVWTLSLILFVLGVAAVYLPGVIAVAGYPLLVVSSGLLLLGTSVF